MRQDLEEGELGYQEKVTDVGRSRIMGIICGGEAWGRLFRR